MGGTLWRRLREALPPIERRAAPVYGVLSGVAIVLPLVVGSAAGSAGHGVIVSLGAYLVAVRAPEGTYGEKARSLFYIVATVGVGSILGGFLVGHVWVSVVVLPLVVFVGVRLPRIGLTFPLATMFAVIRPPIQNPYEGTLLSVVGALFMTLLVLAPWPRRRLRPLTEAFGEAIRAVAGAVDEVMTPHEAGDWEKRRREAADAIGRARGTYGMFHNTSDDSRPARLLRTVVKLMHQVVELRTLLDAEAARPLHTDLTGETRDTVSALAERVRILADTIDPSPFSLQGMLPLGAVRPSATEEQVALGRLEEEVDAARRDAFAGDEDMVAAALAAQAWRSLRRLNATVDSADRLVVSRIVVPPMVPKMPEVPGPASVWTRMVEGGRFRRVSVRAALRSASAMAVAMVIWALVDVPHGHWLPLATLMCLRRTYGETVDRVFDRVGGTALGSAIAAVILALSLGQPALAVVIFVLSVAGFALSPVSYTYWVVLCTPLVLLIVDFAGPVPWSLAAERIGMTIAGAVLALAAARLLWPVARTAELPAALAKLCTTHSEVIRSAVTRDQSAPSMTDTLRNAQEAAEDVTAVADRMALDPIPDTAAVARLRDAVAAAHRIRDEVISVTGLARSESAASGAVTAILEQAADYLEDAAEDVKESGTSQVGDLRIDDLLTDLDSVLSRLARRRRAEVAAGTDIDETTPLRTDLLSVAGVRHALRTLRSDAQALAASLHP